MRFRYVSHVEIHIENVLTDNIQRWCNKLDALCGMEARGIERIPEELRAREMSYKDYLNMFVM